MKEEWKGKLSRQERKWKGREGKRGEERRGKGGWMPREHLMFNIIQICKHLEAPFKSDKSSEEKGEGNRLGL